MAWLPFASTTVEPARFAIERCASGGIILSAVATRYQLGLTFQAGAVTLPSTASMPAGHCDAAMKEASSGRTSAQKASANLSLSRNSNPSTGGRIGGAGAPGGALAIRLKTDSPVSGANAVIYTSPATFGSVPASVTTAPPYEWPARMTSPGADAIACFVSAISWARDKVGFWTIVTL